MFTPRPGNQSYTLPKVFVNLNLLNLNEQRSSRSNLQIYNIYLIIALGCLFKKYHKTLLRRLVGNKWKIN